MTEEWSMRKDNRIKGLYNIISNRSNWFIAEQLTYNNAMTIITHFNNLGHIKIDADGNAIEVEK